MEGGAGGRFDPPVEQRSRPRRHSAAQIERSERSVLHRYRPFRRRNESQTEAGCQRIRREGTHMFFRI